MARTVAVVFGLQLGHLFFSSSFAIMDPMREFNTVGNIAITVISQANGHYLCEATSTLDGQTSPAQRFQGQSSNHAIAIALEHLAYALRVKAEAEQKIAWDAVEHSPSGQVIEKRFHVILHYEQIREDDSKFDAMLNTQMGNTVVENAEISIIQIDPDLQIELLVD